MNINTFNDFTNEVKDIRNYINYIKSVDDLIIRSQSSDKDGLYKSKRKVKIFEYKSIIISIYGLLERYVSLWVQEHISEVGKIFTTYDDLPHIIRENHFQLSIKLISKVHEGRFGKYNHLNKETLITNLSKCINEKSNYSLNCDAFDLSSGNIKHSKVVEVLKLIDISFPQKMKLNETFSAFIKEKNISMSHKPFFLINDLVERRNDIAHGVPIDDILSIDSISDYISFLEHYGRVLFEILVEKETEYETFFSYSKIANVHKVYRNSIVCFEIENCTIKCGDHIIIKTPKEYFLKKKILEIEKDSKGLDFIEVSSSVDIGVNLGKGITEQQIFYIKKVNI
jgi:hypothetical protein